MRFSWMKIKLFFLLVLISGLFYSTISVNNLRDISKTDIYIHDSSNLFITKDSIKSAVIEIITTKNIHKSSVHLKALEFELNKIELVKKSDVFIDVNGTMVIDIEQRKPIARFIDNKFYLDEDGFVMPKSKYYSARVPVIKGYANTQDQLDLIYKLSNYIRDDKFLSQSATEILIDSNSNFSIKLRDYRFKILIGQLNNLDLKIKNFKAFYINASANQILNKYSVINLQFDNQVVCVKI
jgi:cell division protein FtsQ